MYDGPGSRHYLTCLTTTAVREGVVFTSKPVFLSSDINQYTQYPTWFFILERFVVPLTWSQTVT